MCPLGQLVAADNGRVETRPLALPGSHPGGYLPEIKPPLGFLFLPALLPALLLVVSLGSTSLISHFQKNSSPRACLWGSGTWTV